MTIFDFITKSETVENYNIKKYNNILVPWQNRCHGILTNYNVNYNTDY